MNIHLPAILMFTRGTRFWPTATWFLLVETRVLLVDSWHRPWGPQTQEEQQLSESQARDGAADWPRMRTKLVVKKTVFSGDLPAWIDSKSKSIIIYIYYTYMYVYIYSIYIHICMCIYIYTHKCFLIYHMYPYVCLLRVVSQWIKDQGSPTIFPSRSQWFSFPFPSGCPLCEHARTDR